MSEEIKNSKKKLKGTVVSAKSTQTIVVEVERRVKHPMYSKFVNKTKKYHAHDVDSKANIGDVVTIMESRPYSKLKKWELFSIN